MDNEFRDLVFATNSTTFQTLSELDVTQLNIIKAQVDTNTQGIVLLNEQITALGRTVQDYQAANNAHFVTLDTQVIQINDSITAINSNITTLNSQVANINNDIATINIALSKLDTEVSGLVSQVEGNTQSIIDLEAETVKLTEDVELSLKLVTNLNEQLTYQITRIDDNSNDIVQLQGELATAQEQILALQALTVNLGQTTIYANDWYNNARRNLVIQGNVNYSMRSQDGTVSQYRFNGAGPKSYGVYYDVILNNTHIFRPRVLGVGDWDDVSGLISVGAQWKFQDDQGESSTIVAWWPLQ